MKARYLAVGGMTLAVAGLWAAVLLAYPSYHGGPHLPALNGTPHPQPAPGGLASPAPSPAPSGSAPRVQAARSQGSPGMERFEDEVEDEPPGAEGQPPASSGSSAAPPSGSTAQGVAPSALPLPLPSLLPLPTPPVP
jgi:hypothetical protein